MKKLDAIPDEVLEHIQSEHERALAKILADDTAIAKLPARPVQMKIMRPNQDYAKIETVIAPPVNIYISKDNIIDGHLLNTQAIRYVLPYTGEPFPYAHVFSSSGYVCLGSIFVPSTVSIYNPQQPLETLFLHNDANTNHGGASITINQTVIEDIIQLLDSFDIELSHDSESTLLPKQNLLKNDALWILSADIVQQTKNILSAINIMDGVFRIVFRVSKDKKGA